MVVQYEGVREQETLLVHVQSSFPALDALWKDMHAAHVHAACSYVHDRCIQCTYIIDAYVAICHVYCTCISSLVARARMKQNEARTKPRTSNQHNERKAQRKAQTQPQLSQPKSAPSNLLVVTSTRFPDHDHGSCCSRHKFLFAPTSVDGERQARLHIYLDPLYQAAHQNDKDLREKEKNGRVQRRRDVRDTRAPARAYQHHPVLVSVFDHNRITKPNRVIYITTTFFYSPLFFQAGSNSSSSSYCIYSSKEKGCLKALGRRGAEQLVNQNDLVL